MFQKKQIDYGTEYSKLQERAKIVSSILGKHENKNLIKVSFPITNYRKVTIENRDFYYAGTNIFLGIVEDVLLSAQQKFPEKFGNENAYSILSALNKTRYLHNRMIDAIRIYNNENFIWIYDNLDNGEENRIIRLDLFRQFKQKPLAKGKWEFIGGLFHALKHFSHKGIPLSTGKDINDIENVEQVIFLIIKAFYLNEGEFDENKKTYTVLLNLNEKYDLKFIFYYEENTKVYFITTIHKVKRRVRN